MPVPKAHACEPSGMHQWQPLGALTVLHVLQQLLYILCSIHLLIESGDCASPLYNCCSCCRRCTRAPPVDGSEKLQHHIVSAR